MPDHVHLVVRGHGLPVSTLMETFKRFCAHIVNASRHRSGRVWQPGYHDVMLTDERVFEQAIRYCLDNPVRAGLVKEWRDWPFAWSRWIP